MHRAQKKIFLNVALESIRTALDNIRSARCAGLLVKNTNKGAWAGLTGEAVYIGDGSNFFAAGRCTHTALVVCLPDGRQVSHQQAQACQDLLTSHVNQYATPSCIVLKKKFLKCRMLNAEWQISNDRFGQAVVDTSFVGKVAWFLRAPGLHGKIRLGKKNWQCWFILQS